MAVAQRCRGWTFTEFGTETEREVIMDALEPFNYIIIGLEICPTTLREHYQGYVYFTNPRTIGGLKRIMPKAHWERAKGTPEQNRVYCSKDGDYEEHGDIPEQGKRTDVIQITTRLGEGKSDKDLYEEFGDRALRINGCIARARIALASVPRTWEMNVRIYWGASGTGKSRSVWDEFGYDKVYPKPASKWWDGYTGQECVLIDDFDPGTCFETAFDMFLRLLDRYPLIVEFKGGSTQFCSKVIVITSNFDPESWFIGRKNRDAFFRRVNEIRHFGTGTEVQQGNTSNPAALVMSMYGDPDLLRV